MLSEGEIEHMMPPAIDSAPEWLNAEMPPGYQTRAAEIQRLTEELWQMGRFGRLLWRVGDELTEVVRETFTALGFEAEATNSVSASLVVKLDRDRRLLLHVSASERVLQKRDPELAHVFKMVQEFAEDNDRVILAANANPSVRPADRKEPLAPEALDLLQRMGANVLTGPALFALWTLSLKDVNRAHTWVERLHEQDGGMFQMPAAGAR
jgi:hypothetical protein